MEKKRQNILLIIIGILILLELIAVIFSISNDTTLFSICQLVVLLFVSLYGFWFYKKPHGNMLKYAMLLLAAAQFLVAAEALVKGYGSPYLDTISLFFDAMIVYVAGRLNRIEQNKYLLSIVAIGEIAGSIITVANAGGQAALMIEFVWFSRPILIITILIAYFLRYKEHKEAGLMDAPKAK